MASPPEPLVRIENNLHEPYTKIRSTNSSAPLIMRAARALDRKSLIRHLLLNHALVQIQNSFTEMLLILPSINIAQIVPLRRTKGPPELWIRNILEHHLLLNR